MLITFASTAVLLGLYLNSNQVYADTTDGQITTTQQNDNNSQTQDTTQVDKNDNQGINNTVPNPGQTQNQNNTQTIDNTTQQNQQVDNTNTSQSDTSNNYVQALNDNTVNSTSTSNAYGLSNQASQVLREADININDLTKEQIDLIKQINFDMNVVDSSTHWDYNQYAGTAKKMIDQDKRYRVPYFNAKKIKNMKATVTRDAQTGKKAELEIWDSWPVQDAKTGKVVNYKGYQLMIAMMGIPNQNDAHIYLLYNKYKDNNFNHWKTAGPIFGFNAKPTAQEWSGSATVVVSNCSILMLIQVKEQTIKRFLPLTYV